MEIHKKSSKALCLSTIIAIMSIAVTAVSHYTSALTYEDLIDVEFTFNPAINVTLSSTDLIIPDLAPGSGSDSNLVTVSVATNAGHGYYLAATAGTNTGTTDLVNSDDSSCVFANLSSTASDLNAMPDNSWGYAYSTDDGTTWVNGDAGSTTAGYGGLPLDNDDSGATGIKLIDSDPLANSGEVKFKIAAKAAINQTSGSYSNTVNFYAVANSAPEEP